MKIITTALAFLLLASLSRPARAQWYVLGEAGLSQPIDQISKNASQKTDAEFKTGTALALALGRRIAAGGGALRLEAEVGWRDNDANKFSVGTVSRDFTGKGARAFTIDGNALYDFENGSPLTPFLGAGLGLALAREDIVYGLSSLHGHSTSIAWQLIGGVSTPLSARTDAFVRGRFVSAPSLHFEHQSASGTARLGSEFDGFIVGAWVRTALGAAPSRPAKRRQGPAGPWYLSAQVGGAQQRRQASEGSGQRIGMRFSPGVFAALALGRRFALGGGRIRTELELSSRNNDTRTLAFNGFDLSDVAANGAYDFTLMGNVLYDLPPIAGLRPYGGAGAGVVHSAVYARYNGIFINGSDETFGYQLIGGLSRALGERLEIFAEGRHLHAAHPDFVRTTPAGSAALRSQYRSWGGAAGFRYYFGQR